MNGALAFATVAVPSILSEGCRQPAAESPAESAIELAPGQSADEMEPQVARRLDEVRRATLAEPLSASVWGRLGMVAHAHELWAEAAPAYERARKLDPEDVRWPYFLGDVISVLGTDLPAAESQFRRALVLRPDYPPTHWRLGAVLAALNLPEKAAIEFEQALTLDPELQPARVALAQIRLSQGELETSRALLESVLEAAPRHGQALSTLAQVYMRQGRRDEARQIAERSRDAASYNLYSDPLMGEVVAESVSSVQIWERAKSFLDNGNYQQAVLGLRQVVSLQPSNEAAHLELAVAYGHLGEPDRSRVHLERAVALGPDQVDPRVRLGGLYLEQHNPQAAIKHLRKALELSPGRSEAAEATWLLGKALVAAGDLSGGLSAFESEASRSIEVPAWVETDWGRALAETGRPEDALEHFRAALDADPEDPQAHFYIGLVSEGLGRTDQAVAHYCRSMAARANPPAVARLEAMNRTCH